MCSRVRKTITPVPLLLAQKVTMPRVMHTYLDLQKLGSLLTEVYVFGLVRHPDEIVSPSTDPFMMQVSFVARQTGTLFRVAFAFILQHSSGLAASVLP